MSHQVENKQETCGGLAAVGWAAFASPEPSDETQGRAHRAGRAIFPHDTAATFAVARFGAAD
jgi:hypothetical protein